MEVLRTTEFYQFIDPKKSINPKEYGIDDLHVFNPFINSINVFAIGQYFWYISNNKESKVHLVSNNIESFTPFTKEEWLSSSGLFFIHLFHPDDRPYLLRAFAYAANVFLGVEEAKRNNLTFNFYGRMLNEKNEYRWIMLTSPHHLVNSNNEIEASLLVIYDISHLSFSNMPLLSVMNSDEKGIQYFKHANQKMEEISPILPYITKREKEILILIAKGYNTQEIADILFISYHTVHNHKRNIRHKTGTKTSAELIAYIIKHNLIFM